ncbi:MAG: transposase [Lachnospiraceae bacterium]|nr:transposase [Lachnospiraceae bacterium]
MEDNRADLTATLTDEQWDVIEALIPLIGKQKEWEISKNRLHVKCLWDREEDAPYQLDDAVSAIKNAVTLPLDEYGLSTKQAGILKELLS